MIIQREVIPRRGKGERRCVETRDNADDADERGIRGFARRVEKVRETRVESGRDVEIRVAARKRKEKEGSAEGRRRQGRNKIVLRRRTVAASRRPRDTPSALRRLPLSLPPLRRGILFFRLGRCLVSFRRSLNSSLPGPRVVKARARVLYECE